MDSFFEYLKGEKVLWIDSVERTAARIQKEFEKAQVIFEELDHKEQVSIPEKMFLNADSCLSVFEQATVVAVSYTHLTLPTILLV